MIKKSLSGIVKLKKKMSLSHIHTHTHTNTHTHTQTHTLSLPLPFTRTHTHTLSPSLSLSHTHSFSLCLCVCLSVSLIQLIHFFSLHHFRFSRFYFRFCAWSHWPLTVQICSNTVPLYSHVFQYCSPLFTCVSILFVPVLFPLVHRWSNTVSPCSQVF